MKEYSQLREQVSAQIARENVIKTNIELELQSKAELLKRYAAQRESSEREGVSGDSMIAECESRYALLNGAISNCSAEQKGLLGARETLGEYCFASV